jgi:drug/metabolite transporter (DMT)-like permease
MIGGDLAAVVFGLASALTWGAGDFSGGLATKRAPVLGVLAISHGAGLLLLLGLALAWGEQVPALSDLAWGFAGGVAGAFGLASLYRGLAIGQMGLVAPLSAVLTAALPVAAGALTEGLPGTNTLLGFGLALVGIWLVAGAGSAAGSRAGLGLAVLAGLGFGAFFILAHRAGGSAVFWPLVAARVASLAFVVPLALGRGHLVRPDGRLLGVILLSGACDAAGNAFYVLASQAGRLDVAAVLSSLYPASTVLLAMVLLGERLSRPQIAGIVVTLAAIALMTQGAG